jgi:ABC-type Fe3+-hydroxamate transport system substrate-binding protein
LRSPQTIVSLVPSLTEALFSLGLGERVVGVTEWCIHPARGVAPLPKLGGTKNPDLEAIRELAPDLVIANREENRKGDVAKLREWGHDVWVTYPTTVREGAELLRELAGLGASEDRVRSVVDPVFEALEGAEDRPSGHRPRVFCPIWKDPWMSVGHDTYAQNLIELCGGSNVFADLPDRRYPRVTEEEIVAAAPEVILLPDEPYRFSESDAEALGSWPIPAAREGRIHCIDGTLVSWYGPRIRRAIEVLRNLLRGT